MSILLYFIKEKSGIAGSIALTVSLIEKSPQYKQDDQCNDP